MELFILVNEPKLGVNAQIWSIRIHSKSFSWPFTVKNYEQAYLDLLMNRRVNGQTDGRTDDSTGTWNLDQPTKNIRNTKNQNHARYFNGPHVN